MRDDTRTVVGIITNGEKHLAVLDCGHRIRIGHEHYIGRCLRCPTCQHKSTIPRGLLSKRARPSELHHFRSFLQPTERFTR